MRLVRPIQSARNLPGGLLKLGYVFLGWCLLAGGAQAETGDVPVLPANLAVPPGRALTLTLVARGVQIYECRMTAGQTNRFQWMLIAPEAELFDEQNRKVGRHYAGPAWELVEGGKVIGRVLAKADAPDGRGVPWLLLEAVQTAGPVFGKVKNVQRLQTIGGLPPSQAPDAASAGCQLRVPYSAVYKFYSGNG